MSSSESVVEHLKKLRAERMAREKARIEQLKELNLKKYNKTDLHIPFKPLQASSSTIAKSEFKKPIANPLKTQLNGPTKRPITAPNNERKSIFNPTDKKATASATNNTRKSIFNLVDKKITASATNGNRKSIFDAGDRKITATSGSKSHDNLVKNDARLNKTEVGAKKQDMNVTAKGKANVTKTNSNDTAGKDKKTVNTELPKKPVKVEGSTNRQPSTSSRMSVNPVIRKSFAPNIVAANKAIGARKSTQPQQTVTKSVQNGASTSDRLSVFERLYQPRPVHNKKLVSDAEKLQSDPNYFKKVIQNASLILNKRHTVFEPPKERQTHVRRSISAVHLKRINKSELANCVHKWSSIGDKLDKVHLEDINEDEGIKEDKIVSAVKSERKRVKFQTPYKFNTPRPEELQSRLQSWLQKRGKALDSYHHLQCFGIHHLARNEIKPLNLDTSKFEDDEDKENQPLESDSDNDSYEDNMNNKTCKEVKDSDKWRRASGISDSVVDFNETATSTLTSVDTNEDDLLFGALSDLTELLKEGFDWEQCARWLKCLRERFPTARQTAAYWECRAALEERRGDISASVYCWEEAVAQGTQHSVLDANLDQLLDKFMQLKISPTSGKKRQPDPKLVDIKNVFKSALIRFAVQRARMRQSQETKFTVTPVRRSGRISAHWSAKKTPTQGNAAKLERSARRTPLQVCSTFEQAGLLGHPLEFVPNDALCDTP